MSLRQVNSWNIGFLFGPLLIVLLLNGCQSTEKSAVALNQVPVSDVNQLVLVDCLLPGQVKQLGTKMTYLTPRRPARITASECSLRGGEYTLYDRANLASSLNVWMPLAQEGDAEAQNFLAQIYENGVNGNPDYQLAALWYERAAKQGLKAAKVALGFLYESGLGVQQDKVKALNLYRDAAGIERDDLDYSSTIEQKVQEQIKQWQKKLQSQQKMTKLKDQEIKSLREQYNALLKQKTSSATPNEGQFQKDLLKLTKALESKEKELIALRQKARQERTGLQMQLSGLSNQNTELNRLYMDKQNELVKLNETLIQATAKYNALKQNILDSESIASAANKDKQALLAKYTASQLALVESTNKQENFQQQLKFYSETIAQLNEELNDKSKAQDVSKKALQSNIDALKLELNQTKTLLEQQAQTIERLNKDNLELTQTIDLQRLTQQKQVIDSQIKNAATMHKQLVSTDQSKLQLSAKVVALNTSLKTQGTPEFDQNNQDLGFGNFHALIIGNDKYEYLPNLNTAVEDAKAVENVLRTQYGYSTTLLLNTSRDEMLTEVFNLKQKLNKNSNLLIYYAGHGEIRDSRGYWLLSNASATDNYNWVPTQQVTDLISQFDARKIIIIADSCYSGLLTRRSVLSPGIKIDLDNQKYNRWLKAMAKGKSRTVLTSGGLQPVLDGGGGRHSIFAKHFLSALSANRDVLDAHTLFNQIFPDIKEEAVTLNVEQSPQYAPIKNANHYSVDYFFIKKT